MGFKKLKKQRSTSRKPPPLIFNFVYFGVLFVGLAIMHVYSVAVAAHFASSSPWVFVIHAIIQAGVEAAIFAYIAAVLQNKGWKILQKIFIIATVIVCIAHFIDFHLVRIMDISIWYALDFVLDESWRNFLELLIASTVPFTKIFFGAALLCAAFLLAIYFFRRSQAFIQEKYLAGRFSRKILRSNKQRAALLVTLISLGVWEYATVTTMGVNEYERLSKALPLKRIFFSPSSKTPKLACRLKPALEEKEFQYALTTQATSLAKKPNIYLFVIETLREEFLTPEIAPYLHAFKKENISFQETRASSNTTPISWFSLFFAQSPLHFGEIKKANWESGCPTVQILKDAGYKLHLYSASRLSYYGMDQMLFGPNSRLADDYYISLPSRDHPAWQCDRASVAKLCADVKAFKEEEGHLFVTFIESTHFDYSWPHDQEKSLAPFCNEINFFKAACLKENMTGIQNSYRNSIHYIDGLMGEVFATLDRTGQMEHSIVVVTADHGEEFFEQGNLFHASALSQEQIRVPLYCRFGNRETAALSVTAQMASHVDILPSILHHLYGEEKFVDVLQGQSIFRENRWPFIITGRYNGSRSPHEFLVQSQSGKVLHVRFSDPSNPAESRFLQILDCKDPSSQFVDVSPQQMENEFGEAFGKLFQKF